MVRWKQEEEQRKTQKNSKVHPHGFGKKCPMHYVEVLRHTFESHPYNSTKAIQVTSPHFELRPIENPKLLESKRREQHNKKT